MPSWHVFAGNGHKNKSVLKIKGIVLLWNGYTTHLSIPSKFDEFLQV